MKYVVKTVNAFAFTIKLKLVMKGNELELKQHATLSRYRVTVASKLSRMKTSLFEIDWSNFIVRKGCLD